MATKKRIATKKEAAPVPKEVGVKSAKNSTTKKIVSAASSMEELLQKTGYQLSAPKRGDVIKGLVTDVSRKAVLVDIGAKTEGVVLGQELEVAADLVTGLRVGDEIEVFVKNPENDQGQILLSLRQAAEDKRWDRFKELLETKKPVEVKGLEVNRGGLIVVMDGVRGFVPSSQFSQEYLGRMDRLIDKTFKAVVIEVERSTSRLIFSEKLVGEAEGIAKKGEALKRVKIGDVAEGVVSGVMPFGVFVTTTVEVDEEHEEAALPQASQASGQVGRLEGLIHISEISWEKVEDPNLHFKVGDRVKCQVIGIDEDTGKLNLSIKRLLNDPWAEIQKRYAEGTQHEGEVIRIAPFGTFVHFEAGIDGLIHISKMPAGKEFKVGEEVKVYVEMLDIEHRRMSLGIVLTEAPVGYK